MNETAMEAAVQTVRRLVILGFLVGLLSALLAAPALIMAPADATPRVAAPSSAAGMPHVSTTNATSARAWAQVSDLPSDPDIGGIIGTGCGLMAIVCGDDEGGDDGGDGSLPGFIIGGGDPGDVGNVIGGVADIINPFETIGSAIAKAAATAWTAAMLAIWSAGLLILRLVLTFAEWFLTPDLRPNGPGREVYSYSLWAALGLAGIMVLIQLGLAAFKREGKSLARAAIGSAQFVLVCACWFGYCVAIVAACGALTRALMKALLGINSWPEFNPLGDFSTKDMTDAVIATALGFLGFFLVLAAIGHLLVYLARGAALMILAATGPIAAAGLVSEPGRPWFWKTLRWFHAAAFTPVLMVLVLGIGVQFANGAMVGMGVNDPTLSALGTAIPAVIIVVIHVFAPLSLFKLLAFVDPGTPSGASFRQGMAIHGGIKGLLGGGSSTGTQASKADDHGRSAGEAGADDATAGRFAKSIGGLGKTAGGGLVAGQALSRGLGMLQSLGAKSTSLMSDVTNQAGIGDHTYGPDFSNVGAEGRPTHPGMAGGDASGSDGSSGNDDGDDSSRTPPPPPPPPPKPPSGPPPQVPPRVSRQSTPPPPPPAGAPSDDTSNGNPPPPGRAVAPPSRPPRT